MSRIPFLVGHAHGLANLRKTPDDVVGLADAVGYADRQKVRELFETGVDIDALMVLRQQLAIRLQGEALRGNFWRAGLSRTLLGNPAGAGV